MLPAPSCAEHEHSTLHAYACAILYMGARLWLQCVREYSVPGAACVLLVCVQVAGLLRCVSACKGWFQDAAAAAITKRCVLIWDRVYTQVFVCVVCCAPFQLYVATSKGCISQINCCCVAWLPIL